MALRPHGWFARTAYADFDGVEFVLGHCADGLYVASSPDEAEGMTRELEGRAADELARAKRRRSFDWKREAKQLDLFEPMRRSA